MARLRTGRVAGRLGGMTSRTWTLLLVALLIAALTFFVSRKLGFTLLLLPLFFLWGGPKDR